MRKLYIYHYYFALFTGWTSPKIDEILKGARYINWSFPLDFALMYTNHSESHSVEQFSSILVQEMNNIITVILKGNYYIFDIYIFFYFLNFLEYWFFYNYMDIPRLYHHEWHREAAKK